MISDYAGGEEAALAAGLTSFETLTNALDEYKKTESGKGPAPSPPAGSTPVPALQPPPVYQSPFNANPFQQSPGASKVDEAPLISFD